MRPTYDGKLDRLYFALCGTAAAAFLIVAVIGASLRLADQLRPRTGDILSFDLAKGAVSDNQTMITAGLVGNPPVASCVLKPHVMQTPGGSLVIEATQFESSLSYQVLTYQVHWAGGHTSDNGADCGTSADLLLRPADLSTLSLAAGGWG
jgi:hypothetical protein